MVPFVWSFEPWQTKDQRRMVQHPARFYADQAVQRYGYIPLQQVVYNGLDAIDFWRWCMKLPEIRETNS